MSGTGLMSLTRCMIDETAQNGAGFRPYTKPWLGLVATVCYRPRWAPIEPGRIVRQARVWLMKGQQGGAILLRSHP
jgi:hypothetical protein